MSYVPQGCTSVLLNLPIPLKRQVRACAALHDLTTTEYMRRALAAAVESERPALVQAFGRAEN